MLTQDNVEFSQLKKDNEKKNQIDQILKRLPPFVFSKGGEYNITVEEGVALKDYSSSPKSKDQLVRFDLSKRTIGIQSTSNGKFTITLELIYKGKTITKTFDV